MENPKLNRIVKLINLYRSHPILWDVKSKDFRRQDLRAKAYEEIAAEMCMTPDAVKKKIHSIRSTYTGEKRKMSVGLSGDKVYVTSLCWYNEMSFLDSSIVTRKCSDISNEVRLDQKRVRHAAVKKAKSNSPEIYEYSSLENKNADKTHNFFHINTESNDSLGKDSIGPTTSSIIEIKPEQVQEVIVKDNMDTVEHETTFGIDHYENESIDTNAETSTHNPSIQSLQSDSLVERPAKSGKNKHCYTNLLNEYDDHSTNRDDFEAQRKKKKKPVGDDPLDDSTSYSNEYFEQWAWKKKHLLEIEHLEMRNYKFKLELYEKEKELGLVCSKFTRDIRSNR